jgi:Spy/CpxP family protein refolding chaperone
MSRIRVVLAMVAVLLVATAVMAAEGEKKADKLHPLASAMMRMERFHNALEQLDLSAEQKEKLKTIHEEFGPKMKAVFEKIHEALSEEQRKAAEEAMKTAKAAGKKGRALFAEIEAAVKPTDEQKEKMAKFAPEVVALHKEAAKAVMGVLTPEQQNTLKEKLRPAGKGKKEHKHESTETK